MPHDIQFYRNKDIALCNFKGNVFYCIYIYIYIRFGLVLQISVHLKDKNSNIKRESAQKLNKGWVVIYCM